MRHFLIIDGNSLGHQSNSAGKPLQIGTMQVQAIYHFLNKMRSYLGKYSFATPIVLWDGNPWREAKYPEYKKNREALKSASDMKRAEERKAYHAQRPHIKKALSLLGVTQIDAMNMEADDLAAILCNLYVGQGHSVHLLTEDQDWLQLVRPGVGMERIRSGDRITTKNFEEKTGVSTPAQFIELKALMGDSGDNIKGVGGIGETRAREFLKTYGSFNAFLNMVTLEKSIDVATLPKHFRNLVEDEAKAIAFDFNIKLVDLNTPVRPAPLGMNVDKGAPNEDGFRRFCEILLFNSILSRFDDFLSVFPVRLSQAVKAA